MRVEVIGNICEHLKVTTYDEYLEELGIEPDEDPSHEEFEKYQAIQNILSCDVSIYLTRRTGYLCGSVTDNLKSLQVECINRYEEKYNTKYIDFNNKVDW